MSMTSFSTSLRPEFKEALHEALERYPTPFYAYDLIRIQEQLSRLREHFNEARIFYAAKANPRLGLLRRFRDGGLDLEAASFGEVWRAYHAGFHPRQVLWNGPVKTPEQLQRAKTLGMPMISLDSIAQAQRVAELAPGSQVLLRVNPDLPVHTHPHLATGQGESQFGILPQDLEEALAASQGLEVLGLHLHLGSLLETEDFLQGYALLDELLKDLHLPVIDLGGGFGLGVDLAAVGEAAHALSRRYAAELWIEPGRLLVAQAGVLLTRCWGIKRTRRTYLLLDAGMSALIRPMLYGAVHPVLPLYTSSTWETYDLAGPSCERGDVIARDLRLPQPKEGDALAILEAGAYGSAMSSNYLDQPRPLELLWNGASWEVLRFSQGLEALWEQEP